MFKIERTSVDLALLHVLSRHRVRLDDVRQSVGLEILLARLFLSATFSGVLLHALQVIGTSAKLILSLFEEVSGLFTHLNHPVGWVAEHFHDAGYLVVLGRAGE